MIEAARDAGLNANFDTDYAGATGVPTAMGAAGADRVKRVANRHPNDPTVKGQEIVEGFEKKFNDADSTMRTHAALRMLGEGMKRAKPTEPLRVAHAMSGLRFTTLNGEVEMRASDPPLQQPVSIAVWTKVDGKAVRCDAMRPGEHRIRLEDHPAAGCLRRRAADLVPDESARTPLSPGRRPGCAGRRASRPTAGAMPGRPPAHRASGRGRAGPPRPPRARRALPAAERSLFTITLLNGPSHGLLLFMLSSGLTLIFSRMGVLNSRTRRSTGSVRNSRTR